MIAVGMQYLMHADTSKVAIHSKKKKNIVNLPQTFFMFEVIFLCVGILRDFVTIK